VGLSVRSPISDRSSDQDHEAKFFFFVSTQFVYSGHGLYESVSS